MKKRLLAATLSAVMLASVCAGCSSNQNNSSGTSGEKGQSSKKNLVYLSNETNEYILDAFDQVLEGFQKEVDADFTIERQQVADKPSYLQKLKTLVASNEVPDIFDCDVDPYGKTLLDQGIMKDLTEVSEKYGLKDVYLEGCYNWCCFPDGTLVGLSNQYTPEMIYYNTEVFEKAGVEVPETVDDFVEACKTIADKTNVTPLAVAGKENWHAMRFLTFVTYRLAGNDFLFGLMDGSVHMSDEIGMKACEFVQEIGPYFQEGFANYDGASTRDYFVSGSAAMYYQGSWDLPYMQDDKLPDNMKGKVDCFLMPTIDGAINTREEYWTSGGGMPMCFNAETFNSTTEEFINFYANHYGPIVEKNIFSPIKGSGAPGDSELTQKISGYLSNLKESCIPFDCRLDAATYEIMGKEICELAMGNLSPEQFAKEIDDSLAEYVANTQS